MEVLFWGAPFPGHCVSFIIRERVHTTQGTQSLPQAHGYRLRPTYFTSVRALSKIKKRCTYLCRCPDFSSLKIKKVFNSCNAGEVLTLKERP